MTHLNVARYRVREYRYFVIDIIQTAHFDDVGRNIPWGFRLT